MSDEKTDLEIETLEDSQSEQKTETEDSGETQPSRPDVKKVEDDVLKEWTTMSGSTQDRIRKLVEEKNRLRKLNDEIRQSFKSSPAEPVAPATPTDMSVQEALDKLRNYGIATTDDVNQAIGRVYLEQDHSKLENKYSGKSGLPKYVREEVEDFARTNGFGANFEAAFKQMYFDEFVDAAKGKSPSKEPYTEKPTSSLRIGEKPLSLTTLRERLQQPDGPNWWAKNREKIEPLLSKLQEEA
jgi:hypothetical protein